MSHFSVLVIGDNVEEQLAPYHEFECTGDDNEYVVDIDKTEGYTKDYLGDSRKMMKNMETGELLDLYDDMFYREPTHEEKKEHSMCGTGCGGGVLWTSKDWGDGKGYRAKVHYCPEGYEEVNVPFKDIMSFSEYISGYNGISILNPGDEKGEDHRYIYAEADENGVVTRVVRRTNPNAKWDFYLVGGRWGEYFIDRMKNPIVQGPKKSFGFEFIRDRAEEEARETFSRWNDICQKHGRPILWSVFIKMADNGEITMKEARERYNNQPAIKAWGHDHFWDNPEEIGYDLDEYVENCRNESCSTHAIVIDGKWYERGKMGWWACVHDEKDGDEWNREFNNLIDSVDDDTMITVVDCHI